MASNDLEQLGKRLRQARQKRELTMAELRDISKVAASTISSIERGSQAPTTETVKHLAKALKVDPCWLAYGTGVAPTWQD